VSTIPGVLSPEECALIISEVEAAGPEEAPVTTRHGMVMMKHIRNNRRVMMDDPDRATRLWERVRQDIVPHFEGWDAIGLNERSRYYRYDVGQYFAPHYDGSFARSPVEKSWFTLMAYLNDGFEGGETAFLDRPEVIIEPRAGDAPVFFHAQCHEGRTVTRGRKYALRTDAMYRRRGER